MTRLNSTSVMFDGRKNIGIDVSLVRRKNGMGVLLQSLLPYILEDKSIVFTLFSSNKESLKIIPDSGNIKKVYFPFDIIKKQNPLFEQIILPVLLIFNNVDTFFYPYNLTPFIKLRSYRSVVLVHDTMFMSKSIINKRISDSIATIYRRFFAQKALFNSQQIITVSYKSKKDIENLLLKVKRKKSTNIQIEVIPNCINKIYFTQISKEDSLNLYSLEKDNYLLAFLAFDPRKKSKEVLDIFINIKLKSRGFSNNGLKLVFVGCMEFKKTFEFKYCETNNIKDVIFTGVVSNEILVDLYTFCKVFLFLSAQEGFGIPLVEAMSRNAYIISDKNELSIEILGHYRNVLFINDFSKDSYEKIANLIDSNINKANTEKETVEQFSPAITASNYLNILKKM